jgi:hypothetical protein
MALAGLGIQMALEPFAGMLKHVNMETAMAFYAMAGGIGLLAMSIASLAASLLLVSTEDLKSLGKILQGVSSLSGANIKLAMEQVEKVMVTGVKLADDSGGIEKMTEMFKAAELAQKALAATGARASVAAAAPQTTATTTNQTPYAGPPIKIEVKIDRDKVGESIIKWSEFRNKLAGAGI